MYVLSMYVYMTLVYVCMYMYVCMYVCIHLMDSFIRLNYFFLFSCASSSIPGATRIHTSCCLRRTPWLLAAAEILQFIWYIHTYIHTYNVTVSHLWKAHIYVIRNTYILHIYSTYYMHTYIHTYINKLRSTLHTLTNLEAHTYTHTYIHTYILAWMGLDL
jgi:hypothetical protein